MKFTEMNLKPPIISQLKKMDVIDPTEIQEESIPKILKGDHFLGQAKTGSGKTLAFSIPLVQMINPERFEALILVPTRELCKQVAQVIKHIGKTVNIKVLEVYGGVSIGPQIMALAEGVNVVVATPGRLIDLYKRRDLHFDEIKYVVLDEADRMFDMGFMPDLEYILLTAMKNVSPKLYLFSATLFEDIKNLAQKFIDGKLVEVNVSEDEMTVDSCEQESYLVNDFYDKYPTFVEVIRKERPKHTLIFVNTKKTAEWLYHRLKRENKIRMRPELISGDLSQQKRESVLKKFKTQQINSLIATDVASRGLDLPDITHVVNYDLPKFEEDYVHRIGRTSRMDKKGKAITLVLKDEIRYLCRIEGFIDKPIPQKKIAIQKGSRPRNSRRHSNRRSSNRRRSNRRSSNRRHSNRGHSNRRGSGEQKDSGRKKPFNPFY